MRRILGHAPTLFVALQQVCKWAPLEDTILNMWLEHDVDHIRICSQLEGTTGLLHLEHSQWLQNIFLIYIVRQFVGPDWAPRTIAFEARYMPALETQALWPNTRFLSSQPASWIDVPIELLSLANLQNEPAPKPPDDDAGPSGSELIGALKLMLPAYLDEGAPNISEVAEMAGISTRSFQRKLSMAGLTYSGLLNTVRFESAAKRLRETDAKIIDIALSSGYADPAHFTRAFRRISGITPREFRSKWSPR
jgi:AraC-like DNA-binding protein